MTSDRPLLKQRLRKEWAREITIARSTSCGCSPASSTAAIGAAGSLREGMEETLTLNRLGINGSLKRTLESTNPCESMIEMVRRTQPNLKHWSSGEMGLRWAAAGMLEAERQFRRIIGYRDLATLALAIEGDLAPTTAPSPTEEAAIFITA